MTYPASFGMMLIRGMAGYIMFYHGAQKLLGWFGGPGIAAFAKNLPDLGIPNIPPEALAYAAAISEFAGGICLMLGFLTRFAAVFVAGTMAVAVFKVHWGEFALQKGGIEYAALIMFIAIGLIFAGPGRLAIDNLFRRRAAPTPPPRKK